MRRYEKAASEFLTMQASNALASLPQSTTYKHRVLAFFRLRLSHGPVGVEQAAQSLRMSTRTLRRRLEVEGETYAALLDAYRAEQAIALVADENLTIDMLAYMLGFSGSPSFRRAFNRWHQCSPTVYRAKLTQQKGKH